MPHARFRAVWHRAWPWARCRARGNPAATRGADTTPPDRQGGNRTLFSYGFTNSEIQTRIHATLHGGGQTSGQGGR
ncbi:hypothetical protein [Komagataeibacter rhaeticus]|uniref:hypothetical protein n=1 Tax=Komagataeibacter rhaeticus TaxID=215221 RepID=UPI001F0AE16E|nr:hypothetical protein [Komagataeibacter rhaeticus]